MQNKNRLNSLIHKLNGLKAGVGIGISILIENIEAGNKDPEFLAELRGSVTELYNLINQMDCNESLNKPLSNEREDI